MLRDEHCNLIAIVHPLSVEVVAADMQTPYGAATLFQVLSLFLLERSGLTVGRAESLFRLRLGRVESG